MKHFHERLKHIRKINGFNQKFIAEKVGSSQSNYCKYEKGVIDPNLSFIRKVLKLYNANPSWLINGEGEMMSPVDDKKDSSTKVIDTGGKDIANISLTATFIISFEDLEAAIGKSKLDVYNGKYPISISVLFSKYLDYQNNLSDVPKIKETPIITIETVWSSQYVVLHKFLDSNDIAYAIG